MQTTKVDCNLLMKISISLRISLRNSFRSVFTLSFKPQTLLMLVFGSGFLLAKAAMVFEIKTGFINTDFHPRTTATCFKIVKKSSI